MAHIFHFLCVACALFDDVVVPLFLAIIKDEQKKRWEHNGCRASRFFCAVFRMIRSIGVEARSIPSSIRLALFPSPTLTLDSNVLDAFFLSLWTSNHLTIRMTMFKMDLSPKRNEERENEREWTRKERNETFNKLTEKKLTQCNQIEGPFSL